MYDQQLRSPLKRLKLTAFYVSAPPSNIISVFMNLVIKMGSLVAVTHSYTTKDKFSM